MKNLFICYKLHLINTKIYFIEMVKNTFLFIGSCALFITIPIWYLLIKFILFLMKPYEERKVKEAIKKHMDRMFPKRRK